MLDNLALATQLGGILLAPPIVGLLLGQFLDEKMGTGPAWSVGLLILGLMSGLWSMYKHLKQGMRNEP